MQYAVERCGGDSDVGVGGVDHGEEGKGLVTQIKALNIPLGAVERCGSDRGVWNKKDSKEIARSTAELFVYPCSAWCRCC